MGFPQTLQEFQVAFPDEESCGEALRQARWPKGFVCPRCGHAGSSWIATRRLEQCSRCRYQCSVTAGTVLRKVQGPDRAHSSKILPWNHTIFGNLKTWLRGTFHGVSRKHLQRYLDEFVYRFDRRWREGELFGFVLRRAAHGEPLPYSRLVAEATG